MSAPAPGFVPAPEPTVKVRLGDSANAAACVSLTFSLLLVVSPAYFPDVIIESWFTGRLTAGLLLFALLFNCALYMRIARLRSSKTDPLAFLAIGLGTAMTVIGFSCLLPAAVLMTQWRVQARAHEEVLALAYFAVVAAVFFPFFIIRFTQDLRKPRATH
jgi:hypothetical protein